MTRNLTEVWSPIGILLALGAGLGFGVLVIPGMIRSRRLPNFRPAAWGWTIFVAVGALGFAFYATQILEAFYSGDPLWHRVLSRYLVWLMFSAAVGAGTWIVLRWRTRP